MAEITLEAAPILGGADIEIGENRIVERDDLALVSIATPLGGEAALEAALNSGWSLGMPTPTRATQAGETWAIRTTADQLMLVFPHAAPDANTIVQGKLKGASYTTDQTDVWVVLEISGPDTLAALERLCPIDLHADAFPEGAAARTLMEHMGAMILRLGSERFLLMSASSSAASFLHAVETSYAYVTD